MSQEEIIEQFRLAHKDIDYDSLSASYKSKGYGYHIYFDYSDCSLDLEVYSSVDGQPVQLLESTVSTVYDIVWKEFQEYQDELRLDENDFKYIY